MTVRKKRRVQQEGIAFEGSHSIDPLLAAYAGEDVLIRYDPADMAEIRVFRQDRFICRAICPELCGQTVSLQEIVAARSAQGGCVRKTLKKRRKMVQRFARGEGVGETGLDEREASETFPPKRRAFPLPWRKGRQECPMRDHVWSHCP